MSRRTTEVVEHNHPKAASETFPPELTKLGVFADNRTRPIHRWYPFIEGYSSDLVNDELRTASTATRVFDPFAGSGTTLLAAALRGHPSFYCEVNPYLSWVTNVKINVTRSAWRDKTLSQLLELAERLESGEKYSGSPNHPLNIADSQRDFFPKGVASSIVGILESIDCKLSGEVAELARLAVTTSLIPASNMIRRTDLRRRRGSDPLPQLLAPTIAYRLRMIHNDCLANGPLLRAGTTRACSDVRSFEGKHLMFDLAITSPPYLNGTNYCRNTKLEMLALRILGAENELAPLRAQSITAGINNVSKRRTIPNFIAPAEHIAKKLDKVAYDIRIPTMVRSYFSDMSNALRQIRNHAAADGRLLLDIGDSRFAGIHVPTDTILVEIAKDQGWSFVSSKVLRKRRSYDGSDLVQVLLEFKVPK